MVRDSDLPGEQQIQLRTSVIIGTCKVRPDASLYV
jgi:hypothetical protein